MLSHYNIVNQLFIPSVHTRQHIADSVARGEPAPSPYRTLAHVPIAHIAGVQGYLVAPMFSNGAVYWMDKFVWSKFLQYFKELKITAFWTVPSIYLRIAKDPAVTDQFDHVEAAMTGAAPMDKELQNAANARIGKGKVKIGSTWGLSETTVSHCLFIYTYIYIYIFSCYTVERGALCSITFPYQSNWCISFSFNNTICTYSPCFVLRLPLSNPLTPPRAP